MKNNLGSLDQKLRVFIGLFIILSGLVFEAWWAYLGLIPIITAAMNWCPLYSSLDISTNTNEDAKQKVSD